VHPVGAEGVDERGDVVRPVPHPSPRVDRQRVGVAVAPQVDRERPHAAGVGQGEHRLLPEQRRADVAVHEEHDLPGPGRVDALGVQDVLGQPRGAHPGRGGAGQQRVAHAVSSQVAGGTP
jgi:hypothetical protein